MTYLELLNILSEYQEEEFAAFQRKLIFTERKILGVRTPTLRKLAKELAQFIEDIYAFPNEYYEVVFIKLTIVSAMKYEHFLQYLPSCVDLIDCWALCDSFKANCIKTHKDEFLSSLEEIFSRGGEYHERYPLVVFLSEYMEEKYFPLIENYIRRANTSRYYVHMAVAWLIAEILIKHYDFGKNLLIRRVVDAKTHNRAIQKAIESYRFTSKQKEYLRSLKIKTK